MKILKWIGITIATLIFIVILAGILLPKELHTERMADIKAPVGVVYDQIADFHNWPSWSAWYAMDPKTKMDYFGETGKVGSGYTWQSEKTGQGKITITSIKPNEEIDCDLEFIKPMSQKSTSNFMLKEENGVTKVTWGYSGHYGIPMNVMMALMSGDMKKSFDQGLEKLKEVSEAKAAEGPKAVYEVKEVNLEAKPYLMVRKEMKWSEVNSAFFADGFKKDGEVMKKNKLKMAGPPTGLVFKWDDKTQTTDMAAAIAVADNKGATGDVKAFKLDAGKALSVDYYGAYDKMQGAYAAIDKSIKDKGLKKKFPAIEEYITDPMSQPDTSKWLTKIYVPVE